MSLGPLALLAVVAAQPVAPAPPAATPVAPPPAAVWPALGAAPGGRWVCDPEHERWRQADLALARADLSKGLKGAAPDLPQLEAALAHAPAEPVGGVVTCGDRTYAFNSPASLVALALAARRPPGGGAPPAPFTVEPRPMPYAELALLVGSIRNASDRPDLAAAALDRGLAVEPDHPRLVSEKAFALNQMGRSAEAAEICAHALTAAGGAPGGDLARLHRGRGYALGELGRYDEAIAEYRASQALDPSETVSANEITYLQGRKAGRGPSGVRTFTSDQAGKPQR